MLKIKLASLSLSNIICVENSRSIIKESCKIKCPFLNGHKCLFLNKELDSSHMGYFKKAEC